MRIIELRAENVKRLTAVSIRPEGNVVTISGRNGQGKSSVLDAIAWALGGKDLHQPEAIRRGADSAQVVVDLGDLVVERRWTPKGTYLEVKSKEGAKYPSPQAMLDKFFGALSFDPLGFLRLERKKQLETVRELTGLDTKEFDARRVAVAERRTEANRKCTELQSRVDAMPKPSADAPLQRVSVDELLDKQSELQAQKQSNDKVRAAADQVAMHLSMCRDQVLARSREVEELEKELAAARLRLKESQQHEQRLVAEKVAAVEKAQGLVDPDVAEVVRAISRAGAVNAAVTAGEERVKLELELQRRREEHQLLDAEVARIDGDKAKAIAAAPFPVEGLGFGADGLTYEGLPFEQASSAQQLRVAVAMAIKLNAKSKVMLVRAGNDLDRNSMQLLGELAASADLQVWVERVVDEPGKAVGIVIEDGQVLEHETTSAGAA